VHLSKLLGANRRFIEQHVPHIGSLLRPDLAEVVSASDLLVLGLNDRATLDALRPLLHEDHMIVDLVGIAEPQSLRGQYAGLCW